MSGRRKWATMSEVAQAAGVGTITVSRVLRTPERVRPETRERVEQAIRALGYVPDEAAGALSSRRSRMVGALVSTLAGSVFARTIDGLTHGLRAGGCQLLLANTDYEAEVEAEFVVTMLGRRPDGLALTSTEHTPETERLLRRAGVPVVELWELPETPIDSAVGFSNRDAGRAMTAFLAESGYRRIGFIAGAPSHDSRGRRRFEGYAETLAALDLGEPRFAPIDGVATASEAGAKGLAALLERWPDTQAVFCVSDPTALGAISEARRRGLSVPGDLAIAGFGDFELAGEHGLGLTTLRVPGFEIGEKAAELILAGASDGARGQVIDVGFEIVRRGTA